MDEREIFSIKKLYDQLQHVPNQDVVDIKPTERTPRVVLNKYDGSIKFSGRSMPDNARTFYQPIIEWIEDYKKTPAQKTTLTFNLEYFNSSSSKMFLQIINTLKPLESKDGGLSIRWYYIEDDEEIFDSGKIFEEVSELKFDFECYQ